jgi:diguanylate cyclase
VILLAALTFFAVNYLVVGVAVALFLEVPAAPYLRSEFGFSALTGAVLLALAPIVLAATQYAPALFVVFLLPLLAIYRGSSQAAVREREAMHDPLTGLLNRAAFRATVQRDATDAGDAVLLMDLNRFKDINDALGHQHGDRLLRQVSERLVAALPEGPVLARLGGDEFAVFAPGVHDEEEIAALAGTLAESFERPFELGDIALDVDASIGAARCPEHGTDAEDLLRHADVAMYQAKGAHLGFTLYSSGLDDHSRAHLALAGDLGRALESRGGILLHYQPKLDAASRACRSVEALVRWDHPALGLLAPGSFVPLAERTGLIKRLTACVLDEALAQQRRWLDCGIELDVAVNVSARSLLDPDFPDQVADVLERRGAHPRGLTLEITESMIMGDPDVAHRNLDLLHALGVRLSIDDFGTGYSSLAYLNDLAVDELKIDRSFVTGLVPGGSAEVIVRTVIDLGRNLGLAVVAEGVETRAELDQLARLGCTTVQGYHVSPPVDAAALEAWLLRNGDSTAGRGESDALASFVVHDDAHP